MIGKHAIGIFDSGLGGLSIMKAIRKLLPAEDLLYFGDCHFAPYGDRTEDYIVERAFSICDYFIERDVKAIVIACNTATAAAANKVRLHYDLPIIGVEPAIKPAVAASYTQKIGVLATTRTIKSTRYKNLIDRFAKGVEVISVACPGLMEIVEKGLWNEGSTYRLIDQYVAPFLLAGADQVVLGCTHYPFLSRQIASRLPPGTTLVDPSIPVARELTHRLSLINKLTKENKIGREEFIVTGDIGEPSTVISRLWNKDAVIYPAPPSVMHEPETIF